MIQALTSLAFLATGAPYFVATIVRQRCVKGTMRWHRANSVAAWLRPLVIPVMSLDKFVHFVARVRDGDLVGALIWGALDAVIVLIWWKFILGDEDDDPWGDLGRKIKNRLTSVPPITAQQGA